MLAGGCSGFTYELSFADAPASDDNVVETDGVKVLVDPKSAPIVQGSTLDFDDAMLGGGLKVRNPQAVHECACGDFLLDLDPGASFIVAGSALERAAFFARRRGRSLLVERRSAPSTRTRSATWCRCRGSPSR